MTGVVNAKKDEKTNGLQSMKPKENDRYRDLGNERNAELMRRRKLLQHGELLALYNDFGHD
jgi:hypothetical protein